MTGKARAAIGKVVVPETEHPPFARSTTGGLVPSIRSAVAARDRAWPGREGDARNGTVRGARPFPTGCDQGVMSSAAAAPEAMGRGGS